MPKSAIIGSIVLVLALGGIIYYAAIAPAPAATTSGAATFTLPASGSYTEHAAYYDIAANYPTTTPLAASVGASADAAARAKMQATVSGVIDQFKTDGKFTTLTPADAAYMGLSSTTKESLQINYLIASSPHTVSYIFTTYEDTLGAHPNTTFATLTFDTSTGAELALGDLFQSGADYLDPLSTLSRQLLPVIIGPDADPTFIDPGTTPDASNFQSFFLDNSNLDILFAPYQVAPYSDGPQTLPIPDSQLANILKPEYQ